MSNFEGIGEICTNAVREWIADDTLGRDPDMFRLQRFSSSEARKLAREADDFVQAAAILQSWFTDRLTADPGVPGPFAPVACTLLLNAIELVNWYQIAEEIRE
ncbi:MAG: hypothetical protein U0835_24815 [Isosphaeraceae bacterium]